MKPARFAYHRPTSVKEAVSLLAGYGPEARIIAGGQSLIPMMNSRSVSVGHLVDINRISELESLRADLNEVRIGAIVRQRAVERSPGVATQCSLLPEALRWVGSPAIRNRGTVVGSIVHADPAGEVAAIFMAVGGVLTAKSVTGEREIRAEDFFAGPFQTALRTDELATEVRFNSLGLGVGSAFVEIARRRGDRAICGVAAVTDGSTGRLAFVGVGPSPLMADVTDALSEGVSSAVAVGVDMLEPVDDIHATAAYRRHLARVLAVRALEEAIRRSKKIKRQPE